MMKFFFLEKLADFDLKLRKVVRIMASQQEQIDRLKQAISNQNQTIQEVAEDVEREENQIQALIEQLRELQTGNPIPELDELATQLETSTDNLRSIKTRLDSTPAETAQPTPEVPPLSVDPTPPPNE